MEIKPVKNIETPKYPLKTEVPEEELKKQIPKRWAQSPAAKIALGTLAVVTLAGCAPEVLAGVAEAVTPPTEASESVTPTNYLPEGTTAPAMINVAPLFVHGDGQGAFGCLMIAPPVFLSEFEALTVINEAAKEYGLHFSDANTPDFANVLQPITELYPPLPPTDGADPAATDTNTIIMLKTDFSDNKHGITIEYVSTNDVESWNKSEPTISAGSYDTRDAAAQLSEALEGAYNAKGVEYAAGVLYDPCASVNPDDLSDQKEREEAEVKAREMSEEQLKAQAKDFFEWLKDRGVI